MKRKYETYAGTLYMRSTRTRTDWAEITSVVLDLAAFGAFVLAAIGLWWATS